MTIHSISLYDVILYDVIESRPKPEPSLPGMVVEVRKDIVQFENGPERHIRLCGPMLIEEVWLFRAGFRLTKVNYKNGASSFGKIYVKEDVLIRKNGDFWLVKQVGHDTVHPCKYYHVLQWFYKGFTGKEMIESWRSEIIL